MIDVYEFGLGIGLLLAFCVAVPLYFAPTIVAAIRGQYLYWPIFFVNLFFGWILVGWVMGFVLVFSEAPIRQTSASPPPPPNGKPGANEAS